MKYFRSISILLFFFSFTLYIKAQKAHIEWGPQEKAKKLGEFNEVLGWNNGNYYTWKQHLSNMANRSNYVDKVDRKLQYTITDKLERFSYASYAKIINDQIYFFNIKSVSVVDDEEFKGLHYYVFDLNGNFLRENTTSPFEGVKMKSYSKKNVQISESPDGSKVGFAIIEEQLKENYIKIINGVFDISEMENIIINSKTIQLPSKIEEKMEFDLAITNNGSLITSYGYKEEYDDPYFRHLVIMNLDKGYMPVIPLKTNEGIYFGNLKMEPNKDDILFSGSYITQKNKKNMANGFFLAQIDMKAGEITNISSFPYTEEFFQSLGYKIKKDGRIKFSGNYRLKIVPNKESGGGFLIADHYDYVGTSVRTEEAIIIPFDSEGKLKGNIVLAKNQQTGFSNDFGLGYFAFIKNDNLHMIYNDALENAAITGLEEIQEMKDLDHRKTGAIMATIFSDGKIQKEKLFTFKEQDGYLVPEKCSYSEDNILLSIIDKKKVKYGKLVLN